VNLNLEESIIKTQYELELLEFDLEESESLQQQIDIIAQILKKQYLMETFKLMQPFSKELQEKDLQELRAIMREWFSRIDATTKAIREGSLIGCDDQLISILDKMLPYLKGKIKNVSYYKSCRHFWVEIITIPLSSNFLGITP